MVHSYVDLPQETLGLLFGGFDTLQVKTTNIRWVRIYKRISSGLLFLPDSLLHKNSFKELELHRQRNIIFQSGYITIFIISVYDLSVPNL